MSDIDRSAPMTAVQYREIARTIREAVTQLISERVRTELLFLAARYERLAEFAATDTEIQTPT